MKPIGPLMIEHRLIERMVKLLAAELENIKKTSDVNTSLINAGVDFFAPMLIELTMAKRRRSSSENLHKSSCQ